MVGDSLNGFTPLQLQGQTCEGFFCSLAIQDVGFSAFVVIAFSIGFAAGFMRR